MKSTGRRSQPRLRNGSGALHEHVFTYDFVVRPGNVLLRKKRSSKSTESEAIKEDASQPRLWSTHALVDKAGGRDANEMKRALMNFHDRSPSLPLEDSDNDNCVYPGGLCATPSAESTWARTSPRRTQTPRALEHAMFADQPRRRTPSQKNYSFDDSCITHRRAAPPSSGSSCSTTVSSTESPVHRSKSSGDNFSPPDRRQSRRASVRKRPSPRSPDSCDLDTPSQHHHRNSPTTKAAMASSLSFRRKKSRRRKGFLHLLNSRQSASRIVTAIFMLFVMSFAVTFVTNATTTTSNGDDGSSLDANGSARVLFFGGKTKPWKKTPPGRKLPAVPALKRLARPANSSKAAPAAAGAISGRHDLPLPERRHNDAPNQTTKRPPSLPGLRGTAENDQAPSVGVVALQQMHATLPPPPLALRKNNASPNAPASSRSALRGGGSELTTPRKGSAAAAAAALFHHRSVGAPQCGADALDPNDVAFTVVTQLSLNRLWMMEHHCQRWQHAFSIAVFVGTDATATITSLREQLGHLGCAEHRLAVQIVSGYSEEEYPVNVLRNTALSAVKTSHVVYVDIDFWESTDLHAVLLLHRAVLASDPKVALVVPAFQLSRQCLDWRDCREENVPLMPLVKDQLIDLMVEHQANAFDPSNVGGHGSTRYKEWFLQTESELVPIECVNSNRYEPYLVVRYCNDLPPFQEAFTGYGKNKMTWVMQMRRRGYQFLQLGAAFVVHYPHLDSAARMHWNGGADGKQLQKPASADLSVYKRGQIDQTFVAFKRWLAQTVPDEAVVPLCDDALDDDQRLWIGPDRQQQP